MTRYQPEKLVSVGISFVTVLTLLNTIVTAQTTNIKGIIKERSGSTMILQIPESATVSVLLTDYTEVGQIQGALKARRKKMSMAALIPGLAIQVEGIYNDQRQLEAKSVKFKGDDLERAKSIQAGLHETKMRARQNTEELEKQNAALRIQKEELKQQQDDLREQQQQLTVQQAKINSNKEAIEAAIARFGQLDDYYILDQVSIYFGNGKVAVEPKYKPELLRLAQKAKTIQAYMIEIKGYASSLGSAALNQKLSEDRASNVANFLMQQGHVPLTNMLAPGAMGESNQVGRDKTAEGQAENRRVVVSVLQNKGIAGP